MEQKFPSDLTTFITVTRVTKVVEVELLDKPGGGDLPREHPDPASADYLRIVPSQGDIVGGIELAGEQGREERWLMDDEPDDDLLHVVLRRTVYLGIEQEEEVGSAYPADELVPLPLDELERTAPHNLGRIPAAREVSPKELGHNDLHRLGRIRFRLPDRLVEYRFPDMLGGDVVEPSQADASGRAGIEQVGLLVDDGEVLVVPNLDLLDDRRERSERHRDQRVVLNLKGEQDIGGGNGDPVRPEGVIADRPVHLLVHEVPRRVADDPKTAVGLGGDLRGQPGQKVPLGVEIGKANEKQGHHVLFRVGCTLPRIEVVRFLGCPNNDVVLVRPTQYNPSHHAN